MKDDKKLKTFKVRCDYCDKPFYVTLSLCQPSTDGKGKVVMKCVYCNELTLAEIPRMYINETQFLQNLEKIREKYQINFGKPKLKQSGLSKVVKLAKGLMKKK